MFLVNSYCVEPKNNHEDVFQQIIAKRNKLRLHHFHDTMTTLKN